jgi:hypothetical protein
VIGWQRDAPALRDVLVEGRAVDELHREEPGVALVDELVQRHEVGVTQIRELAELILESVNVDGVLLIERLERDPRIALQI